MKNLETIDSKLKMNIQLLASEGEDNSQDLEDEVNDQSSQSNEQSQNTEKTFTQADVDKIIGKQFAKWQQKIEAEKKKEAEKVEEAKKLANMSAEEKSKKEIEDMKKQLQEFQQREARKDLETTTLKIMSEKGIDADFLSFIIGDDADTTKERLDLFESKFNSMLQTKVEAQINDRLRGVVPKSSTLTNPKGDYTIEDVKAMSPSEINSNWEKIKHLL